MEDHYEAVYLLSKLPENVSERGVRKLFEKKHNLHMSQYEHIPNHRAAIATFETTRDSPELARDACVLRNQRVQLNLLCIEITSFSIHGSVIDRVGVDVLKDLASEQYLTFNHQDGSFHVSGCWTGVEDFRKAVRKILGKFSSHSGSGEVDEIPHDSLSSLISQASEGGHLRDSGAQFTSLHLHSRTPPRADHPSSRPHVPQMLTSSGSSVVPSTTSAAPLIPSMVTQPMHPPKTKSPTTTTSKVQTITTTTKSPAITIGGTHPITTTTKVYTGTVTMASEIKPPVSSGLPLSASTKHSTLPVSATPRTVPGGGGGLVDSGHRTVPAMSFPSREHSHSLPLTSTPAPDPLHTSRPKVTPVVDSLLPPNYSNLHLPIHTSAGHSDIDISQILASVSVPTSSAGTGPKIPDAPYMDEIGDLDPSALYLMKKLGVCQMTGITLNCGIGSVTLSASREQGLDEMRNMFLTSYSELHPPLVMEIKYNTLDDTDVLQSFAAECDNKYKNTAFWMDRKSKVLRLVSNKETELERAHTQLSSHVTAHQVERSRFYGDHYLSKSEKPVATTAVGLPTATAPPPTTRTATFTVDSLVLQPAKVPLGTPSIFEAAANPQERPDGSAHTSIPPSSGGLVDPRVAHHHKTTQGQLRVSGSGSEASFTTAGGSPLDHPHTHSHVSRSSQKDKSPSSEEMMLLNDGRVTLRLKKGNIVEEVVDVIVNAANSHLKHLGGVAADLNEASEGVLQVLSDDYVQSKGPVSVGGVCGTQAGGRLKCSFVFHAVGPKAGEQDKDKTEKLLKSVCTNALQLAESNQVKTIAFPAISTGIFGVDVDIVSRMLIKSLVEYPYAPTSSVKEVRLVIFPEDTFEHFLGYFRRKRNHLMKKVRGVSPGRVPSRVPSGSSDPSKVKTSSRSSHDMKLLGNLGNVGDPKNIRLQSEEKKPWK